MADKKPAVDEVVKHQEVVPTTLSKPAVHSVLARRLKAVQATGNNSPKMQRALNRLATNINK